jgi:ankyrin repeat protein
VAIANVFAVVRRLLLAVDGIDVNAGGNNSLTALMAACYQGHDKCVRLLLAVDGINANATSVDRWTALMFACFEGHIECVTQLLYTCRLAKGR